jgi:hypothetical protein
MIYIIGLQAVSPNPDVLDERPGDASINALIDISGCRIWVCLKEGVRYYRVVVIVCALWVSV